MEFSDNHHKTPPHDEILKLLNLQALHYESMSTKRKQQTTSHKSYAAAIEEGCTTCNWGSHPLTNCHQFQKMTRDERWDVVRKDARCKNCLKQGHMASNKCRAPQCVRSAGNTTITYCTLRRMLRKKKRRRRRKEPTQHHRKEKR